jgi:hypothetical protein
MSKADVVKEKEDHASQLNPAFYALSKLRRRKFDDCVNQCTTLLTEAPLDQVSAVTDLPAPSLCHVSPVPHLLALLCVRRPCG